MAFYGKRADSIMARIVRAVAYQTALQEFVRRALDQDLKLEPNLTMDIMMKVYVVAEERPRSRARRLLDRLRTLDAAEV